MLPWAKSPHGLHEIAISGGYKLKVTLCCLAEWCLLRFMDCKMCQQVSCVRAMRALDNVHMTKLLFTTSLQAEAQAQTNSPQVKRQITLGHLFPHSLFSFNKLRQQKTVGYVLPVHLICCRFCLSFVFLDWFLTACRRDSRGRGVSWLLVHC